MKLLNFSKYLIISRPIIFPLILLCLFTALAYSTPSLSEVNLTQIIFIFLLTFMLPFFTFSINDLEDFNSDKINIRKKSILFGKHISNLKDYSRSIYIYNFIIFIFLLVYSMLFFNVEVTIILFFLLFFLYFYSARPIRFKERLFLDFFSNGIVALLTFATIYSLFNDFYLLAIDVYVVSISIMCYHLIAAQIDFNSDKKAKHKTTATIINNKTLVYFICFLLNLPLLFINLKGNFKYLFFVNLFIILVLYLFPKVKKKWLFFIFIISWGFITLTYVLANLF